MRCQEARRRIDSRCREAIDLQSDSDLRDHLCVCDDCRSYADLTETMDRLLETARADDTVELSTLDQQRSKVETRLRLKPERRLGGVGRAALRMARPFYRRPAFRLSLATVTVVLAAAALVPFEYYRTVGYDLNIQGVSRYLGHSDEQICELLTNLGLVEAGVELKGCDTTCSLAILDLKSVGEVSLVTGAITRLNEPGVTTSIVPIRARETRSLLEQANDLIRRGDS